MLCSSADDDIVFCTVIIGVSALEIDPLREQINGFKKQFRQTIRKDTGRDKRWLGSMEGACRTRLFPPRDIETRHLQATDAERTRLCPEWLSILGSTPACRNPAEWIDAKAGS